MLFSCSCFARPPDVAEGGRDVLQPFKYEAQTALFEDPVRTAQ